MNKVDIFGIGAVVVDELAVLPEYPQADTKIEIINMVKQVGGPVPTALKLLAKLGLQTSFSGKIGDDYNGQYIKDELVRSSVDISHLVQEKNTRSGCAQVWIDVKNNTRTIAFGAGSSSAFDYKDLKHHAFPEAGLLHIDGREHVVIKDIIKKYKKSGTKISIDTGNFREKTLELIPLADIAIMPRRFAAALFGDKSLNDLISKMSGKYPSNYAIIITDGINGSICSCQGKIYKQNSFPVKVFDTTGAGDVHAGGIIYGFLNNWNVERTLEFAAAAAAIKCQGLGNLYTLPDLAQIEEYIAEEKQKLDLVSK